MRISICFRVDGPVDAECSAFYWKRADPPRATRIFNRLIANNIFQVKQVQRKTENSNNIRSFYAAKFSNRISRLTPKFITPKFHDQI